MKQYQINMTYMNNPVMRIVNEVFNAPHHGMLWTITIVFVNDDGVCYKEEATVCTITGPKTISKKRFVTGAYFVSKWWNHRMPS